MASLRIEGDLTEMTCFDGYRISFRQLRRSSPAEIHFSLWLELRANGELIEESLLNEQRIELGQDLQAVLRAHGQMTRLARLLEAAALFFNAGGSSEEFAVMLHKFRDPRGEALDLDRAAAFKGPLAFERFELVAAPPAHYPELYFMSRDPQDGVGMRWSGDDLTTLSKQELFDELRETAACVDEVLTDAELDTILDTPTAPAAAAARSALRIAAKSVPAAGTPSRADSGSGDA